MLRRFCDVEVAALMGFPMTFTLPSNLTTRQKWMLLGNSVNPVAIAVVLYPALAQLSRMAQNTDHMTVEEGH